MFEVKEKNEVELWPLMANVKKPKCGVDWEACTAASKQCVRMVNPCSSFAHHVVCQEALISIERFRGRMAPPHIKNMSSCCLDSVGFQRQRHFKVCTHLEILPNLTLVSTASSGSLGLSPRLNCAARSSHAGVTTHLRTIH